MHKWKTKALLSVFLVFVSSFSGCNNAVDHDRSEIAADSLLRLLDKIEILEQLSINMSQNLDLRRSLKTVELTGTNRQFVLPEDCPLIWDAGSLTNITIKDSNNQNIPKSECLIRDDSLIISSIYSKYDTVYITYNPLDPHILNIYKLAQRGNDNAHKPSRFSMSNPLFMSYFLIPAFASLENNKVNPGCIVRSCLLLPGESINYQFDNAFTRIDLHLAALLEHSDLIIKLEGGEGEILAEVKESAIENQWKVISQALVDGDNDSYYRIVLSAPTTNKGAIVLGEPILEDENKRGQVRDKMPNVIIISLDTFRGDSSGFNGYKRNTTPQMDRIAKSSIVFTNAYSHAGNTWNSHQSILSGQYSLTLHFITDGWVDDKNTRFPEQIPFLADYLRNAGYKTVGFPQFFGTFFGIWRGFDFCYFNGGYAIKRTSDARIEKETGWRSSALRWIKRNADDGPFFMFLHTYYPHNPYSGLRFDRFINDGKEEFSKDIYWGDIPNKDWNLTPSNFNDLLHERTDDFIEHMRKIYDRGLRATDSDVGRFYRALTKLGIINNTILIITSDHGEKFGDHRPNMVDHGTLYTADLRVPLLIRAPNLLPSGKKFDFPVSHVDLFPTLMNLLDLDYDHSSYPGRDLLPLISGESPSVPFRHFSNEYGWFSFRENRKKLHLYTRSIYSKVPQWKFFTLEEPLFQEKLNQNLYGKPDYRSSFHAMKAKLLGAIGDALPGWKLLILPGELESYELVDVRGYREFEGRELIPHDSSLRLKEKTDIGFVIEGNVKNMIDIKEPTLLIYNAQSDDTLRFEISRDGHSAEIIAIGKKTQTATSPILGVSAHVLGRSHFGQISDQIIKKGFKGVFLWYGPTDFQPVNAMSSGSLSSEEVEMLRNLGYIQ